jgi:hypothetical protein
MLYDSYGALMRPGEDLGNSSTQASGTSRDKPNQRMVIHTPRTSSLTAGVGPGIVVVSDHLLCCWDEGEREGQQHAP